MTHVQFDHPLLKRGFVITNNDLITRDIKRVKGTRGRAGDQLRALLLDVIEAEITDARFG